MEHGHTHEVMGCGHHVEIVLVLKEKRIIVIRPKHGVQIRAIRLSPPVIRIQICKEFHVLDILADKLMLALTVP